MMKKPMTWMFLAAFAGLSLAAAAIMIPRLKVPEAPKMETIYEFTKADIDGKDKKLADFKGKTLLIVNTASKCGLTPQYEGLEALYRKYKDRGLVVIGFPANDFAGQEPGTNEEIKTFCTTKFNVSFPMMSKITVVGESMDPLYAWLLARTDNKPIEWNFAKFLVGADGKTVTRFGSRTSPQDPALVAAIESALGG